MGNASSSHDHDSQTTPGEVYGPLGTGKTALAHHLAQEADRPFIKRAASEFLSPYLGITEQKLAALRRFDHKLHLQALTQAQRHALFRQLADRLDATDTGDSAAMETALSLLNALDTPTPGDFATVVRRYGQGSASDARLNLSHLAAALESEARIKPGGTARKIGFGSL